LTRSPDQKELPKHLEQMTFWGQMLLDQTQSAEQKVGVCFLPALFVDFGIRGENAAKNESLTFFKFGEF
jgi:hypothetical protein